MLAYHNDQAIKDKYLARVRAHRLADELVQGIGFERNGKTRGCAIGCTLDAYDHARYPIELGIPLEIAYLEDRLFELQTPEAALEWPERVLAAIKPGADLSRVWAHWAVWMLTDEAHGVLRFTVGYADARAAVQSVAALWSRVARGESVDRGEFDKAARAAADAALAAAGAAGAAARADAALAAARAARGAARADAALAAARAARGAARADAALAAARAARVVAACDKLVALLEAA
jgi:hypothetical protein